jgi:hypothetical protein
MVIVPMKVFLIKFDNMYIYIYLYKIN